MQNLPEAFIFISAVVLICIAFTGLAALADVVAQRTLNKRLFPKDYFK